MLPRSWRKQKTKLLIRVNTIYRRVFKIGPVLVLGRFRICRVSYSRLQRLSQSAGLFEEKKRRERGAYLQPRGETIFPGFNADRSVDELRKDGVSLGLNLPSTVVEEVYSLASRLPLQNGVRSRPFLRSEVGPGGRLNDGEMVSLGSAYKRRKGGLLDHECVSRIVHDPVLLDVVSRYLGYWPNRLSDLELYWSFATKLSPSEQMAQGNAIDYHFDLHGFNFVMVAFYLTDTDRHSGAHVMFKKSHHRKTLPMLFSYSQEADTLRRYYGSENETMIEGEAGSGFIMDNSTYHRASTPEASDRLLLRLVYT